jgi:hypothetical protein
MGERPNFLPPEVTKPGELKPGEIEFVSLVPDFMKGKSGEQIFEEAEKAKKGVDTRNRAKELTDGEEKKAA